MRKSTEWDLEELSRGKPKAKHGGFAGRAPGWITSAVREEIKRRLKEGILDELAEKVPLAVHVMKKLMVDPTVDARTRLEAARTIVEYIAGKPDQRVDIGGTARFEHILMDALVLPDGSDAHPVIDGQFTRGDEDNVRRPARDDDTEGPLRTPVRRRALPPASQITSPFDADDIMGASEFDRLDDDDDYPSAVPEERPPRHLRR